MAHCPNAVPSAKTSITDVPGGVEMTVTGADATVVGDIHARLASLVDAQKNQGPNIKHTGTGEGGGLLGRCPVVLKDTDLTVATLDDGSKITIKAKDPQEVDWLRRETRDRQEDLEAAGSPAGAGKMSHCPSAVEGATTTVKNTKDGVAVVVVAVSDDATKAIRDRAKHLVEISKSPDTGAAAVASHTGEGGGGGGIGRCPVVLKDTSLASKDVAGGAQIDVKAKTTAGVTKLQEESMERAAKFQLPRAAASGAPSASAPAGSAPVAPPKPAH
jgi:TusA-related sulfurtransferase